MGISRGTIVASVDVIMILSPDGMFVRGDRGLFEGDVDASS